MSKINRAQDNEGRERGRERERERGRERDGDGGKWHVSRMFK